MNTKIEDYDYFLPPELVAQYPLTERDASRLLVLNRATGEIRHASFRDLPQYLDTDDLLVVNDTRVFPARLHGAKASGGKVELLLHHLPEEEVIIAGQGKKCGTAAPGCSRAGEGACSTSPGPSRKSARAKATYRGRLRVGQELIFRERLQAQVISLPQPGMAEVRFWSINGSDPLQLVMEQGDVPLPPYIHRSPADSDRETYQTI
jgi:S-adenosylmethionine:tRNA ribosyltransferase-isomerase